MDKFKVVIHYSKKYKIEILAVIFLSIIAWILSISMPYLFGYFIDELLSKKSFGVIVFFTKLMIIFSIIDIIVTYFISIISVKFKTKIVYAIIFDTIEHIKKLPLDFLNSMDSAYLNHRINQDANEVVNFIYDNLISLVLNTITFITMFIVIFKFNFKVSCIIAVIIPFYILCYYGFKNRLYKTSFRFKEAKSMFLAKINEQLYIVKLIKTNSWFNDLSKKINESFYLLFDTAITYTRTVYFYNNFIKILRYVATILLVCFGGIEIINNRLTIGKFTVLNSYFMMIIGSVGFFLDFGKSLQEYMVSYNRLKEIIVMQEEINGSIEIKNINRIKITNVSFGYTNETSIIKNFTYEFNKGKIYCILGKNGIGKSTLIDIIIGLRYNYSGVVMYNDYEIKEIDMYNSRRSLIGFVEQEPVLLKDTIKNNIIFGLNNYDENYLNRLCEDMKIEKLLESSLLKEEYKISETNSNISGGEKQKISEIRALMKNPDVLILDEPISALDKNSIIKLKNNLIAIKENKIIIIITHNHEILDIADEFIELE